MLDRGGERRGCGTTEVTKKKHFLKSIKDTRREVILEVKGRECFQKKGWFAATHVSDQVKRTENEKEATGWQFG